MPLSFSGGEFSHIYAWLLTAGAAVIFEFQQPRGNDTRCARKRERKPDIRLYDDLKYSCEKYHLCHSELDGNFRNNRCYASCKKPRSGVQQGGEFANIWIGRADF
jgi:hypothetical protein